MERLQAKDEDQIQEEKDRVRGEDLGSHELQFPDSYRSFCGPLRPFLFFHFYQISGMN